jgi:hypothetical protein
MLDWIFHEWREQRLGVLIVGGQVMVAAGLREETRDVDACLAARQCPRMLAWLAEKEAEGRGVELRHGSAPLHPDWLSRGWTCHVTVDDERLDFFGVPLRASRRIAERFLGDPAEVTLASLVDLGYLKRTERPKDWADLELIASRLRAEGDGDAMLAHLFGEALVAELVENRKRESFRAAVENSHEARQRPILALGLTAPLDELHTMARAEQFFWMSVGARRTQEVVQTLRRFWHKHHHDIHGGGDFSARHARLLQAARHDLPLSPIQDPAGLIDAARGETGTDRWPGLLPPTPDLVAGYFPAYGSVLKSEQLTPPPSHDPES